MELGVFSHHYLGLEALLSARNLIQFKCQKRFAKNECLQKSVDFDLGLFVDIFPTVFWD